MKFSFDADQPNAPHWKNTYVYRWDGDNAAVRCMIPKRRFRPKADVWPDPDAAVQQGKEAISCDRCILLVETARSMDIDKKSGSELNLGVHDRTVLATSRACTVRH